MDTKEQNKEMTAQESLSQISEMLNNNRKSILRSSAKYFIMWGIITAITSLIVYYLWHLTGNPVWNFLWFVLPIVGYVIAWVFSKKDKALPQNVISKLLGSVWLVFGVFMAVLCGVMAFIAPNYIALLVILLLGFADCISGVLLKNWPVIIGGFIFGVGGVISLFLIKGDAGELIFLVGGIILVLTGLIINRQYK